MKVEITRVSPSAGGVSVLDRESCGEKSLAWQALVILRDSQKAIVCVVRGHEQQVANRRQTGQDLWISSSA